MSPFEIDTTAKRQKDVELKLSSRGSMVRAILLVLSNVLGASVLSAPQRFADTGFINSLVAMFLLLVLADVTMRQLLALGDRTKSSSYDALMASQFGAIGVLLLSLVAAVFDLGCTWTYLVSSVELAMPEFHHLITDALFGSKGFVERALLLLIMCIFVCVLLLFSRDMRKLSYVSGVSSLVIAVAMPVLLIRAAQLTPDIRDTRHVEHDFQWSTGNLINVFAVLMFTFTYHESVFGIRRVVPATVRHSDAEAGHASVYEVHDSDRTPKFLLANRIGLGIAFAVMATWGALCSFLLRGEYQGKRILNQNVFLSLSLRDDVTMRVIRLMCAANFLLVAVVVAFFAREYLVSLVQALRSALSPLSLTLANANSSFADTRTMPKRVFVASTFVLTAVLYALCLSPLPSDAINDLFGLLCGVALGLFFPVALYISVHRVPLQKAALSFALCTAFGVGVLGLALGLYTWATDYLTSSHD